MGRIQTEFAPDTVSLPGDTLQEALETRGMTQAELAARTGRTPKLVSEIINGKAPISPDTALQLERVLGVPAEFWNNRERRYREVKARLDERQRLSSAVEWAGLFPLRSMAKLGWIEKRRDKVEQLREVLSFFGVASPDAWEQYWARVSVAYRKSPTFEADDYALAAWLRQGEIEGQSTECAPFQASRLRSVLDRLRPLTRQEPELFEPQLQEMCAGCGVAVALVPELPKIRASGASRWLTPRKALIQVNLRYKTDDHFWFTVFHEAAHVLHDSKRKVYVDREDLNGGEQEAEANRFAMEKLLAQGKLREFARRNGCPPRFPSKAAIRRFAADVGISPGIVVGQLQHLGLLPHSHCNDLKRKLVWAD